MFCKHDADWGKHRHELMQYIRRYKAAITELRIDEVNSKLFQVNVRMNCDCHYVIGFSSMDLAQHYAATLS